MQHAYVQRVVCKICRAIIDSTRTLQYLPFSAGEIADPPLCSVWLCLCLTVVPMFVDAAFDELIVRNIPIHRCNR